MYQKASLLSVIFFLGAFLISPTAATQEVSVKQIKKQIENYKKDPKGPYYRIQWFCNDGSINDPKEPCGDIGGIQHASYKPEVEKLAKENHLYIGNILSYNKYGEFWDTKHNHSRLKQYQIVKYLSSVDDGWIYRKGQYYRGAMQSEDEEAWGKEFYLDLLKDATVTDTDYYLVKQSLKDIPHEGDSNTAQLMRSQSKVLAEQVPSFMNMRIKIHGNPDKTDIEGVQQYRNTHKDQLSADQVKKIDALLQTLDTYYTPVSVEAMIKQISSITSKTNLKEELISTLNYYEKESATDEKVKILSDMICYIRLDFDEVKNAKDRLTLLDLSNKVETSIFIQSQEWKPNNLEGLIKKIQVLSYATLGSGLVELWEWDSVLGISEDQHLPSSMTLKELNQFLKASRSVVEWSTAMVKAVYGEDVERYASFEPKSYQFIDDRVRSSVVLELGQCVSELGNYIAKKSSIENDVLGISKESAIRGLNPGYAYGELVVVQGSVKNIDFSKDKIYVFEHPSSDLKPIAGIMTVSEGNLVSHVQLLARNLGIPNAALSNDNLKSLAKYDGKKVFYAVTNEGNVLMKLEKDMSETEKGLFSKKQRSTNKITVPVDRIELDKTDILNLREVAADDSGKICGPKAANLGQLKAIFPDNVVEGLVIPFGIFRKHLDNKMTGTDTSYWEYLNATYAKADAMRKANKSIQEIDSYQVQRLTTLRTAIEKMELNEDFVSQLDSQFKKAFNAGLGKQPVFLRSDTNMEDLEEFTGAGLNLTLFNIATKKEILDGIKKVWASPYTDRSLKWRQKYLLNPEYVFPSIVVIPGVNNDYSGVVITMGINEGLKNDLTIAFSRGVGGAVEGQSAETRLIHKKGDKLLSPSREPSYMVLPESGSTIKKYATFENPILNPTNIQTIRDLVAEVRVEIPKRTDPDYKGAYDLEIGFTDDKLWLFQIRPFVENKKAKSSDYLHSITPKINYDQEISLSEKI